MALIKRSVLIGCLENVLHAHAAILGVTIVTAGTSRNGSAEIYELAEDKGDRQAAH